MVDYSYAYELDEVVTPIPRPGTMEQHDRSSVLEIKKKIAARGYESSFEVREHLLFLERLADKLQMKLNAEQAEGETGWSLKRSLGKVSETYNILAILLDNME